LDTRNFVRRHHGVQRDICSRVCQPNAIAAIFARADKKSRADALDEEAPSTPVAWNLI
jgi:hypothetical protein